MKQTLKDCDQSIGNLLKMIDEDNYLKTNLNVILTSDHGMHDIRRDQVVRLDDYTDTSLYSAYGRHAFVNIFVHLGKIMLDLVNRLIECLFQSPISIVSTSTCLLCHTVKPSKSLKSLINITTKPTFALVVRERDRLEPSVLIPILTRYSIDCQCWRCHHLAW